MTTLLEAARVVSSLIANRPLGGYWPELSRALTDLANEIAAAESAPAVVTAEEIAAVGANCDDWNKRHKYECKEGILEWRSADSEVAALVAERTAAAVEAARADFETRLRALDDRWAQNAADFVDEARAEEREAAAAALKDAQRDAMFAARSAREAEREACARVADEHAAHERVPTPIAEATRRESLRVAAAIRARGQSEAPAPAPATSTAALDAADLERLIVAIDAVCDRLHSGGPIVEHLEQADTDALHELWKCQLIATRLRAREARVQALVEAAEGARKRCDLCHGTGEWWPHCYRCDDSTDDHDDCPEKRPCTECADLRAALDALGKEGA